MGSCQTKGTRLRDALASLPTSTHHPSFYPQALEALIFKQPGRTTLEEYIDTCSIGQAVLNRGNSKVLGTMALPCTGMGPKGRRWSSDSCGTENTMAIADAVLGKLQAEYRDDYRK